MNAFQFSSTTGSSRTRAARLRHWTALLALSALALLISACSAGNSPTPPAPAEANPTSAGESSDLVELTIGVSPVPHTEILQFVQDNLAADAGLTLTLIEFTDYVQPNLALRDEQLDANFFQHAPYMEDFGAEHGFEMVAVADVHIEPLGIYSKQVTDLAAVPEGALVAIPNDATNGGRALRLLEASGLITLREGADFTATVQDIAENPKSLEIRELDAAQLPRSLEDTTLSVINGNFALDAGLVPSQDALALENAEGN
ncbi:MAG TPA: MetQ/NlpA family ABC transporter substrate-binding protein, partial [Anaerolineaceae bacterium]|nr:MetQ/NlpA family ABC transporter substrate-binding protein [Anaerolineaceae bacterium]